MSILDMTSSFWHVLSHPESRKYTAFQHKGRTYEFQVVSFGLNTSTAALVRGLEYTLRDIGEHMITFVANKLVMTESNGLHLQHLEDLFKRLSESGITLILEKSHFLGLKLNF